MPSFRTPLIVLASPVDDLVVLWKSTVPPFDEGGGTNEDGAPLRRGADVRRPN